MLLEIYIKPFLSEKKKTFDGDSLSDISQSFMTDLEEAGKVGR